MLTQTEIIAKLDTLKTYSITQKPQFEQYYIALMQPVYTAVNTYFSTIPEGMIEALENYVFQTYCDIHTRSIVYENPVEGASLPTDYPTGYNDIRDCFYQFDWVNEITPETFFNAWVEGIPVDPETHLPTGENQPLSNPYLTQWASEISTAHAPEVEAVVSVNTWCETNASSLNLINLLEDQGRILQSSGTQQVANKIYNEHGLLDVLNTRGYSVYIPTYLRGQ